MRGMMLSRRPVLVIGLDEVGAHEAFRAALDAGATVDGGHPTIEALRQALAPTTEPPDDFSDALARIYSILGVRTQVQLAKVLRVGQSSISEAKRRRSIPPSWLMHMVRQGINPDWILTGEGPRYIVPSETSSRRW